MFGPGPWVETHGLPSSRRSATTSAVSNPVKVVQTPARGAGAPRSGRPRAGGASVSSNLIFGVAGCPGSTPGFLPLQLNSVPPGEQRRDSQEEQAERAERSDDGPEGLQMFGGNQVRFQCGQGRAIAESHQDQPGHDGEPFAREEV